MNKYIFTIQKRGKVGAQYISELVIYADSIIQARIDLCLYCNKYGYTEI